MAELNLQSPCCSGKVLIFHKCEALPFSSFRFSSISNDCWASTRPGCTILGLMNRWGITKTDGDGNWFFLSVASLSHVGHFIQYQRNTTPDNVGCVMSRSYGCYGSVCVHWQNGGRSSRLRLYGLCGSGAISEGLIRGDQVVSSTGRSQDS